MVTIFYEDFDKICRACLCKNGEMRPLFGSCLDNMLRIVADVEVDGGDGLPELLCVPCVLQISRAFTFKQQCRRSDQALRGFLNQLQECQSSNQKENEPEIANVNDVQQLMNGSELPTNDCSEQTNSIQIDSNDTTENVDLVVVHSLPADIETTSFDSHAAHDATSNDYSSIVATMVDQNNIQVENLIVEDKTQVNVDQIDKTKQELSTKLREYFDDIKLEAVPLNANQIPAECIRDAFNNYSGNESDTNDAAINPALSKIGGDGESQNSTFFCAICNEQFDLQATYESHVQTTHSDKASSGARENLTTESNQTALANVDVNKNETKNKFECTQCHKIFAENKILKRHLKIHSPIKPHVCTVCSATFAESSNLSKHMKKHTGELRNVVGKPNLCQVCGKGFKWSSSLSKHMKHHTKHKILNCPYCPKYYVEARSLNIHIRSHTGEKPFQCDVCEKSFTQRGNLEKHLRVHTGEKPYQCSICFKRFSQSGYVAIHLRTHTGEKPYTCECGKSFAGSNTLAIHRRTHTGERPYSCTFCDKTFARQETAIIHQRTHTGQKPYICKICNRGFSSSGHLTGHMRSHSGIKTHECEICHKKFAGSSSLRVHMKTHSEKVVQQEPFDNKTSVFECTMCKMNIPSSALTSPAELQAYDHEFIDDVLICSNVASIIDPGKIIEEIQDENGSNIILTTANDIGNGQQLIINLSDLK